MKKVGLILLLLTLLSCQTLEEIIVQERDTQKSHYPEFSWDTVPVCIQVSRKNNNFDDDQLAFMSRFPLITIEKRQAFDIYGDTALGAYKAREDIIARNPNATVLFYWNSRIDYGNYYNFYKNNDGYITLNNPDWQMKNADGTDDFQRGTAYTFDASNEDFRAWWQIRPGEAVTTGKMDGVYIDAIHQYISDQDENMYYWGENKYWQVWNGTHTMIEQLRETVGENKLILVNNIHPTSSYKTKLYEFADGSMIENFVNKDTYTADELVKQIQIVQDAARLGRIIIAKGWPRYTNRNSEEYADLDAETLEAHIREDITFPLACFLIGAGKYSYFAYSYGWYDNTGGLVDYNEYSYALGNPLSDATKNGYIYTRSFEHAEVWVDLEAQVATIDWKE